MISSMTPGRVRIKHLQLRDAEVMGQCLDSLEQISEITQISANPRVGSLLFHYDADAIDMREMQAKLRSGLAGLNIGAEQAAVPVAKSERRSEDRRLGERRHPMPLNLGQGVKLGMLASLGSSMYWAVLGKKGPHKQTGGLFLASLAAHLWMHRKRMFK